MVDSGGNVMAMVSALFRSQTGLRGHWVLTCGSRIASFLADCLCFVNFKCFLDFVKV